MFVDLGLAFGLWGLGFVSMNIVKCRAQLSLAPGKHRGLVLSLRFRVYRGSGLGPH